MLSEKLFTKKKQKHFKSVNQNQNEANNAAIYSMTNSVVSERGIIFKHVAAKMKRRSLKINVVLGNELCLMILSCL